LVLAGEEGGPNSCLCTYLSSENLEFNHIKVVNKYELAHPFHNNHNNNNNKLANNAVNAANINVLVLSVNNELPNNGVVVNKFGLMTLQFFLAHVLVQL
jgi:hypothetical protein